VSCPKHTQTERIRQALGSGQGGQMKEESQGGEAKGAEPML
jgi:hypothetical protein